jgi:transposase
MKDTRLYEQLLGLERPWYVRDVALQLDAGEVVVRVEGEKQEWGCPECGKRMRIHDYTTRRWRHLDSCQFKTILEARVPRVKCEEHGTVTVKVPWAEKHSRFTLLFERLALDVLLDCSAEAARKYLRVSWDEIDHIKQKAVDRGLQRKGVVPSNAICLDEKSVGKGQDYLTVVVKVPQKGGPFVDYVGDGRDEASLAGFWSGHEEDALKAIRCASMDMWQAYINSVEANLPAGKAAITHDPFHIMQNMNKAVDEVRRSEVSLAREQDAAALKGTRFMWLYGFENLPEKWSERIRDLKDSQLKTARAWRLKEQLRAMYQCETWAQAESFFKDWYRDAMRSKLDPVKKVARMLRERLPQVLNYFVFKVTNAYSEGMNSIIQALVKRANGYRNRHRLKRDLFFHLGGLDLYPAIAQ